MAQIVGAKSNIFRCNLQAIQTGGTKAGIVLAADEVWLIDTTNSLTNSLSGNCDAYIVGNGTTAATALELKPINPKEAQLYTEIYGVDENYPYSTTASSLDVQLADIGAVVGENIFFTFSGSGTLALGLTQLIGTTVGTNIPIVSKGDNLYEVTWNAQTNPNCTAMRFWINGDRTDPSQFVFLGDTIPGLKQKFNELNEVVEELSDETSLIIGGDFPIVPTWTTGKRIDTSQTTSSKIVNASAEYAITDYIEVHSANSRLIASGLHGYAGTNSPSINYYDANKNYVGYVYIDGSADVEIPAGTSFVLICQAPVSSYPTSNVTLAFRVDSQFATKEALEALDEKVSALGEINSVVATNDDIDNVSNPNFSFDGQGNLVTTSQVSSGATAFMLFKENVKAIEFTINANWGYGADFCFGYGYHDNTLCNVAVVTMGTYKGYIISSGAAGAAADGLDANASAIGAFGRGLQTGRIFQKMPDVSVGDRCMMEIVCDKYICCYVWKNNKWEDWLMIFPTDLWSFCNIQNDGVRLRHGWNERFGLGVSIPNYNLAGGTTLLSNVKIISKTDTHLFDYHNSVTMRRGRMLKKNWLVLGDSLSSINSDNGWGYVGYAERRTLYNAINLGVSGMYLANIWRQKDTIGWETQVSALAMGDIVTIEGGGNDFIREGDTGVTITLENPNDNYDDTTTLGCLRRIIERIIELNPYVSINVITNQYTKSFTNDTNLAGHTMNYFYGKICEVAKEYNLPYLQLNVECVANKYNIAGLSYDDIHPNQIGSEIIGELVAKMLL